MGRWLDDGLQCFPAACGDRLVCVGLVHDDQIEAAISVDLIGYQVHALVVRDDELIVLLNHLDATASLRVVRDDGRAMDDAVA